MSLCIRRAQGVQSFVVEFLSWRLDHKCTPRVGMAGTGVPVPGGVGTAPGPCPEPLPACPEELLAVTEEGWERRGSGLWCPQLRECPTPFSRRGHLSAQHQTAVRCRARCGGRPGHGRGLRACVCLGCRRKLGDCWGSGVRTPAQLCGSSSLCPGPAHCPLWGERPEPPTALVRSHAPCSCGQASPAAWEPV